VPSCLSIQPHFVGISSFHAYSGFAIHGVMLQYVGLPGSNQSDMFGPVVLDAPNVLPSIAKKDKTLYLGRRKVPAGGKDSDVDSEHDDETEEVEEITNPDTSDRVPVSYHALPVTVLTDLVKAVLVIYCIFSRYIILCDILNYVSLGTSMLYSACCIL